MIGVLYFNEKRYNCVKLYSFGDAVDAAGFVPVISEEDDCPEDILVLCEARITLNDNALEIRGYELLHHDGHAWQDRPAEDGHYGYRSVRFEPYTVFAHFSRSVNFNGRESPLLAD
jgi:hypothetical protein